MAIDFPASPVDQQVFSSPAGIVYRYSSAQTAWLTQSAPPALGGTGDFYATFSGPIPAAAGTILFPTVVTGNAGLWYSVSTGRWTPPAGRYRIQACLAGSPSAAAASNGCVLRKNGTAILQATSSAAAAFMWAEAIVDINVDANGADWFDIQNLGGSVWDRAGATSWFSASPLTGMQGPTGGAPGPVTGDFFATGTGGNLATSPAAVVPGSIITGNSGGYYNLANGRWTPPAGRYFLFGSVQGLTPAAGGTVATYLYKNGVAIPNTQAMNIATATGQTTPFAQAIIDANGTDYFQLYAVGFSATTTISAMCFGATPTQGMVGPAGPAGQALASDTPPASPPPGTLWWNSATAQLMIWFNDGTSTQWVPASPTIVTGSPTGTGDFNGVYTGADFAVSTTPITLPIATIVSGNSGGYYGLGTTSRYTPPAGRYNIFAGLTFYCAAANIVGTITLRKNGVAIGTPMATTQSTLGVLTAVYLQETVDANGSDYFEIFISTSSGANNGRNCFFGAFPLTGLTGVQGGPGPAGPANPTNVFPNYFSGFVGSSASTTSVAFTRGMAADILNTSWLTLSAPLTKTITGPWVAGSGNGGMGTGLTVAANTWYFPTLILVGGAVDIYFDIGASGAYKPAGATTWRRLRPFRTNATSQVTPFYGKGDFVGFNQPFAETFFSGVVALYGVPSYIQVIWVGQFYGSGSTNWGVNFYNQSNNVNNYTIVGNASGQAAGQITLPLAQSGTIYNSVVGTLTANYLWTTGFYDDCGRLD